VTIADRIKADLLAERPAYAKAVCLQCGYGIDPIRASSGGRGRFCSDRCMTYFDAGWQAHRGPKWMLPASESIPVSCILKSASGRSVSEAAKHRERVKRKRAFAESWKRYKAKQKAAASA
jgi:hypothetical protein